MKRMLFILLTGLPLFAARAEPDPALVAGRLASKTLMDALVPQLKAAMQAGGPTAAVSVCANVAQRMTENIQVDHPAVKKVSRVTDRARNPANQAKGADLEIIKTFLKTKSKEDLVVTHEEVSTYYKPLYVQELCLNCHGPSEQLKPEVQALIKQHYPNDAATGYAVGDFRGLIKVQLNKHQLK